MYQEAVSTLALFFQRNIILVYFFYGLAFFSMGLLILLETNRSSSFRIARALTLLAGFGIFHGLHEWFEMFQRLAEAGAADIPPWLLLDEIRVPHLVISFVFLILFGIRLIYANRVGGTNENFFAIFAAGTLLAVWFTSVLITRSVYHPSQGEFVTAVDVLSRYILGIPGALLAAWAIILEQRAFRVRGMSAFGRSLLWGAVALILYGLIGQIFPNPSFLFPANIVNSQLFLELFGFPVQLFRTMMAVAMAVLMVRALRAFDLEQSQRLALANSERLAAQHKALEVQRQARREMEILNQQLQQACEALSAREAL